MSRSGEGIQQPFNEPAQGCGRRSDGDGSQLGIGRRDVVTAVLGIAFASYGRAENEAAALGGCALLLEVRNGRLLVSDGAENARRWVAAPGSTIKPLSLLALLEAHKLSSAEEYLCPRRLVLDGQSLDCSHPYVATPMNASRAIAYSCNCAVAHFARRFETGELGRYLVHAGFCSETGLLKGGEATGGVDTNAAGPACQLQALGERGVSVTPLELLAAYRRLALRAGEERMMPVLDGLEGAVDFGTAQAARVDRVRVAGKTGSVVTRSGAHAAWFAGFAPSRAPEVAAVVLVQGRSGGADAAPMAGKLLSRYFAGRA
jgi:cell division protein FtsI/penicillin-binding protein 2